MERVVGSQGERVAAARAQRQARATASTRLVSAWQPCTEARATASTCRVGERVAAVHRAAQASVKPGGWAGAGHRPGSTVASRATLTLIFSKSISS